MKFIYKVLTSILERYDWGLALIKHIKAHPKIYDLVETIIVAGLLALFIRTFVFQAFKIPSGSMIPTLKPKDQLFVCKFIYWFKEPKVGDIIVFRTPDSIYDKEKPYYIKRVVGTPGDIVEIRLNEYGHGKLYVNGKRVTEPLFIRNNNYVRECRDLNGNFKIFTKEKVPEGEVYVFGDNSPHSYDSRFWGGVPLKNIKGKAMFRHWPLGRIGLIK